MMSRKMWRYRKIAGIAVTSLCLALGIALVTAARARNALDPDIARAISDSSRPATDTTRDALRKPSETLLFADIKSGDKVADYAAGAAYFTRLFADLVGP